MQTDIRNSWLLLGVKVACVAIVLIALLSGYFLITWFAIGAMLAVYEFGSRWRAIVRDFRNMGAGREYRSQVKFGTRTFLFFLFVGPLALWMREDQL